MTLPTLPQIPTDNLYKFKAIGWVSITLAAMLFGAWVTWERELEGARIHAKSALVDRVFNDDTERIRELIDDMRARATSAEIAKEDRVKDSVTAVFRQLSNELVSERAQFAIENERTFTVQMICELVSLLGLGLSALAFRDWQTKHQNYQDRLLVAQSEKAELDAAEARARVASGVRPVDAAPP